MTGTPLGDEMARLGWTAALAAALEQLPSVPGRPVRIVEQHRSEYRVNDGECEFSARTHPALHQALTKADDGIAVGDWARYQDEGDWLTQLLPRRSLLERTREDGRRQRLVANVDTALLVMGMDGDYSPERLLRYRLMAVASNVTPVLVLTKLDRAPDAAAQRREIASLAPDTAVVALDARSPQVPELLAPWLAAGQTLALFGSSGVGKSTLMNNLLGVEAQRTGATQDHQDDLGRHTTTARFLRRLPGGACLIDTPGLRELKLSEKQAKAEDDFADVRQLAAQCRFSDCKHQREPGCAVQRDLPPQRIAAWRDSLVPKKPERKPGKFGRKS